MFGKKVLSLLFLVSQIATIRGCSVSSETSSYVLTTCGSGDDGYYKDTYNNELVEVFNSGTEARKVTTAGFYFAEADNKYYSIATGGGVPTDVTTSDANCSDAGAGKFNSGGNLCLDGTDNNVLGSLNDGNYYVIPKGSIFTGDTTNAVVVAKDNSITEVTIDTKNYLVISKVGGISTVNDIIAVKLDGTIKKVTDFTNDEDYCVSDTTKEITDRTGNFCKTGLSDVDCDKFYTFEDTGNTFSPAQIPKREVTIAGSCTGITGLSACSDGDYYIATASGLQKTPDGKGQLYKCTDKGEGNIVCEKDFNTIGYIKNSDSTVPYIECDALATGDVNGIDTDNEDNCIALDQPSQNSCNSKFVGKLIYDSTDGYQLCIDQSTPMKLNDDAANYLVDASSKSPFEPNGVKSGYFIVAKIGGDNAIRKPQDGKKYIYASGKRVYEKGEEGAQTAICTGDDLKDSTEYILNKDVDSPSVIDYVDYYKDNNPNQD